MTGPVTFTPTPNPTLPDPCDGFDAFDKLADVTDANFELLRNHLTMRQPVGVHYFGTLQPAMFGPVNGSVGGWTNMPANIWPPYTFTVPANPLALICKIYSHLNGREAYWSHMQVGCSLTGPGIPGGLSESYSAVAARNILAMMGKVSMALGSELVGGGQITVQPKHYYANGVNVYHHTGSIEILVYTGTP